MSIFQKAVSGTLSKTMKQLDEATVRLRARDERHIMETAAQMETYTTTGNAATAMLLAPVAVTDAMIAPRPGTMPDDEWRTLAAQLGLQGQVQLGEKARERERRLAARAEVLRTLQREEIEVYPLNAVEKHLAKEMSKIDDEYGSMINGYATLAWLDAREYAEPMPVEVFRLMARITALFPERFAAAPPKLQPKELKKHELRAMIGTEAARVVPHTGLAFVVSKVTRHPDPFLAITGAGLPVVVAKWDEPGFTITGK